MSILASSLITNKITRSSIVADKKAFYDNCNICAFLFVAMKLLVIIFIIKLFLHLDRTEEDNFGGFLKKVEKSQPDQEVP